MKVELLKAEQLELDSKLSKCIFLDPIPNQGDLVVVKVTPKQIQVKAIGDTRSTAFSRSDGKAPDSSPYWNLKLDVKETLAKFTLHQA